MNVADRLEAVVAPTCAELGVELFDLESRPGIVRVTVDRSGGLDLDAIAEVARAISAVLDDADDATPANRYELEVSTPGLERRLRRPEHFTAARGQRLAVRTRPGTAGDRRFEATLVASDGAAIVVRTDDGGERRLAYDDIERAHTVFDWRAALAASRDADDEAVEEDSTTTRGRATTS